MPRPRFLTLFNFTNEDDQPPLFLKKAGKLKYTIVWSPAFQQFEARCQDFPGLSCLAPTREQALEGAKLEVASALKR
ncbi:MAG: hypothetical protein MI863_18350 [Desulfobacterales bacterium]|nr:hypothetical protein [Desulfobacterales bacterium]